MRTFFQKTLDEAKLEQDIETLLSVKQMFKSGDDITISLIQRKCRCGYYSAYRVYENLMLDGKIEIPENSKVAVYL